MYRVALFVFLMFFVGCTPSPSVNGDVQQPTIDSSEVEKFEDGSIIVHWSATPNRPSLETWVEIFPEDRSFKGASDIMRFACSNACGGSEEFATERSLLNSGAGGRYTLQVFVGRYEPRRIDAKSEVEEFVLQ